MHVADRVEVDQEPHPGDHQHHDAGERVDEERQINGEIAAEDPVVGGHFPRHAGPQDADEHDDRAQEGQAHRPAAEAIGADVRVAVPQQTV